MPAIAEWEWLNWKFARAVRAGDTIYARWTLTQKRAPVGGSPTAIVVWRVDVHTAAGALCAEGEVGASVLRKAEVNASIHTEVPVAAAGTPASTIAAAAPRRSRRRRRPATGDGAKSPAEPKAVVAVETAPASPIVPATERPPGSPRRRRRRRSPGSTQARNGDGATGSASAEAPPPKAAVAASTASSALASAGPSSANPLTRAIRRLRRP
ncbi:MAG TPA: hypothetical protein VNU19_01500 [Candidatus Acidoferrum sp.]|nr:hypothetical protein [Candidatus Acidoferrum sp.]